MSVLLVSIVSGRCYTSSIKKVEKGSQIRKDKMKDFVKKLELENYLDESPDELNLKLDELIALGSYN
jgi:hypothetical protein